MAYSFADPFECFQKVSGLDYTTVSRLASNSNAYFNTYIKPTCDANHRFHKLKWKPISTQEMYRFLGIILRMSLTPMDCGGYRYYFTDQDISVDPGGAGNEPLVIEGTTHVVSRYMTLRRFRQIRGAFHPEDKAASEGGDKCYQLRHLVNRFNMATKDAFHTPTQMSFGEGGIGCHSRYCPVRQYNSSKPKPYHISLFILSSATTYQILHLDIYQGRNEANVNINPQLHDFPTTQKAVANACFERNLHQETQGFRHIAADNWYSYPQLCVTLQEQFNCYLTGTCRGNRKGWDKDIMNLSKKDDRGKIVMAYDMTNGVLIGQWNDNKVVGFCSSLNEGGMGTAKRRVGSERLDYPCPLALRHYQNHMFGVDKGDQIRGHFGGFSAKSHFKKWYKGGYMGVLDCGLLNAFIAWNLSAEKRSLKRNRLSRHHFFQYVAQSLCSYTDNVNPTEEDAEYGARPQATFAQRIELAVDATNTTMQTSKTNCDHAPQKPNKPATCQVCNMESKWFLSIKEWRRQTRANVSRCLECGIAAHAQVQMDSTRKIHSLQQFKGLSCWEIMHTPLGYNVWPRPNKKPNLARSHPIVCKLRALHGLPPLGAQKKKRKQPGSNGETDDEQDAVDETEAV
jgi:hypothetical protein